jgi:hypothetical protein
VLRGGRSRCRSWCRCRRRRRRRSRCGRRGRGRNRRLRGRRRRRVVVLTREARRGERQHGEHRGAQCEHRAERFVARHVDTSCGSVTARGRGAVRARRPPRERGCRRWRGRAG